MIELRPYQHTAVAHLIGCLKAHNVAIDASETGVGKTYTALTVTRTLGQPTLVVCPKAVIPTWKRLSIKMGVPLLGVINIEKLKTGNTPFLKKGTRKKEYIWLLKPGNLLIVDEAHRCGGPKSENCNVLAFAKSAQLQVLALSATIAHNPINLRALGYLWTPSIPKLLELEFSKRVLQKPLGRNKLAKWSHKTRTEFETTAHKALSRVWVAFEDR